jgi:hypothetical protein
LRIEAALGKKLKEYETVKEEVMVFSERVSNAQRDAVRQMKDLHEKRGTKGATLREGNRGSGRRQGVEMRWIGRRVRAMVGASSSPISLLAVTALFPTCDLKTNSLRPSAP